MSGTNENVDTIYLDPQYTCEKCGGNGYHTRQHCPNIRADLIVLGVAFIILKADAPTSITCPRCGEMSLDPEDTMRLLRGGRKKADRKKRYLRLCSNCQIERDIEAAV